MNMHVCTITHGYTITHGCTITHVAMGGVENKSQG
jgi:hypothetical protein